MSCLFGAVPRPLALLSIIALISCTITLPISERDQVQLDYQDNLALWQRIGRTTYTCNLVVQCNGCSSLQGVFRDAIVVDDTVRSAVGDTLLTGRQIGELPTVSGLFTKIRGALISNALGLKVWYNPVLGYPESLWVDYSSMSGDEYGFAVDSLKW